MDSPDDPQTRIDAIFQLAAVRQFPPRDIHRRIAELARKGSSEPASLSDQDIREVCYALEVVYAQMGIG